MAYRADGRHDLLNGINEFLDDSLVMPPGYWDKATILPAMQLVREKERQKLKRKEELEAKKGIVLTNCVWFSPCNAFK